MSSRSGDEATYEVRILGRLDGRWSDWLNGATMAFEGEEDGRGITVLTAPLDQAGLRGLLTRIWDLNLTVVSVASLAPTPDPEPAAMPTSPHQDPGAGSGHDPGDVHADREQCTPVLPRDHASCRSPCPRKSHAARSTERGKDT